MVRRIELASVLVVLLISPFWGRQVSEEIWRFAVSGDSRDCGDVVMPAIAKSVLTNSNVRFYWHLGDFRMGYDMDEDMKQASRGKLTISDYQKRAWDDFIENQIQPLGTLTVHLGIGNHELYIHGRTPEGEVQSHKEFITRFSDWLGGAKTAYYRWKLNNVDFINLDNSMDSGFDADQMRWLGGALAQDMADDSIRSVVVGMHRTLANSLACGHSMNGDSYSSADDNAKSLDSGRRAYALLWDFRNTSGKQVYVLSSHSHFFMASTFDTPYWKNRTLYWNENNENAETPLKGWLIGTAGAIRYRLPDTLPPNVLAISYAYGYLLATVNRDGTITFGFRQVTEADIPENIAQKYGRSFVDFCFLANRESKPQVPVQSCSDE